MLPTQVINVGIIGAGRIGIVHLEALASCENANPIIISNPTISKAQAAAEKYKLPSFTADAMEVINNPDVDAVWICSPSQFHADQIKACAAAGKHVFCEKPVATDIEETIEAINCCNEAGVKLMTALQRRFDPNFARIKQALDKGEVGEPIVIKLCSRDPAPPPFEYVKGGGGIFKDMAVHDLDMARFLMGSEPVEIFAMGSCNIDKSIEVRRSLPPCSVAPARPPTPLPTHVRFARVVAGAAGSGGLRHGELHHQVRQRQGRDHRRVPAGAVRIRPARRGARHQGDDPDRQQLPEHRQDLLGVVHGQRRHAVRLLHVAVRAAATPVEKRRHWTAASRVLPPTRANARAHARTRTRTHMHAGTRRRTSSRRSPSSTASSTTSRRRARARTASWRS